MKKSFPLLLTLALLLSLLTSTTAYATPPTYQIHDGDVFDMVAQGVVGNCQIVFDQYANATIIGDPNHTYQNVEIICPENNEVVLRNVKISNTTAGSPIHFVYSNNDLFQEGDVELYHDGDNAAISVHENASLTLYRLLEKESTLKVVSRRGSGIGSNKGENCGTLDLRTVNLEAETLEGNNAAIGGPNANITINSGYIQATAHGDAAAIGSTGTGQITIFKPCLHAIAENGAAIGGPANLQASQILIRGDCIMSTTSTNGAAIGCGQNGTTQSITLFAGRINAKSVNGSAIGCGVGSISEPTLHLGECSITANGQGQDIGSPDSNPANITVTDDAIIFLAHGTIGDTGSSTYHFKNITLRNADGSPVIAGSKVSFHHAGIYKIDTTVMNNSGTVFGIIKDDSEPFYFTRSKDTQKTDTFNSAGSPQDITLTFGDAPCISSRLIDIKGTCLDRNGDPVLGYRAEICSPPSSHSLDKNGQFSFSNVNLYDHNFLIYDDSGRPCANYVVKFVKGTKLGWKLDKMVYPNVLTVTLDERTPGIDLHFKRLDEMRFNLNEVEPSGPLLPAPTAPTNYSITLRGTVLDTTQSPVPSVDVNLGTLNGQTDGAGEFSFGDFKVADQQLRLLEGATAFGEYDLVFSYSTGFSYSISGNTVHIAITPQTKSIDITLEKDGATSSIRKITAYQPNANPSTGDYSTESPLPWVIGSVAVIALLGTLLVGYRRVRA